MDSTNSLERGVENESLEYSDDEEFDNFNVNKENEVNVLLPKRSSRISILSCLDPFNPYKDDTRNLAKSPIHFGRIAGSNDSDTWDANKSFDLLKFDTSMKNESRDEGDTTPTKKESLDIFNTDFLLSPNNSRQSEEQINISQILNESIEQSNVATENLIGLSPVQLVVDKRTFIRLKRHHNEQRLAWSESETKYEERIASLSSEFETKINYLISENEENLERMRLEHNEKIRSERSKMEEMVHELESLKDEIVTRESAIVNHKVCCDEYNDALEALIKENENNVANLSHDNLGLQSCVEQFVKKISECQETISSLYSNQSVLVAELDKKKLALATLSASSRDNDRQLSDSARSYEEQLRDLRSSYEQRVRRLEIKMAHLGQVEANLKVELDLRIRERDQVTATMEALMRDV